MAHEFDYSVGLSILHQSIDPKIISATITELQPAIEAMAGGDRSDREGRMITLARKAMYSHWMADLHPEDRLFSGDVPLSDFIRERLGELEHHRSFFHELSNGGEVTLMIVLYSRSHYLAQVLHAETLRQCGDLGINIELDIYSNCEQ